MREIIVVELMRYATHSIKWEMLGDECPLFNVTKIESEFNYAFVTERR